MWQSRLEQLLKQDRNYGVVFATRRANITHFAEQRGCSRLANLNGCPA